MGYLNINAQTYYNDSSLFGNYQFVSLKEIIDYFMFVYVGEDKIISKASRTDVAFHAQRGLAELSFDTFKSTKSYQIDLPPTLVMPLPQDYVNYTKISWVDSSGIKHRLYPTLCNTSNPFHIRQEDNGDYSFPSGDETLENAGFSNVNGTAPENWTLAAASGTFGDNNFSSMGIDDGKLMWSYNSTSGFGTFYTHVGLIYQAIDVSDLKFIDLSADGVTSDIAFTNPNTNTGTAVGTVRFGVSTTLPDISNLNHIIDPSTPDTPLAQIGMFNLSNSDGEASYMEWTGAENSTKTVEAINVSNVNTIYAIALSFVDATTKIQYGFALKPASNPNGAPTGTLTTPNINSLDNVSIINTYASTSLSSPIGNEKNSSTWNNYKSNTSSENNNDDYEDDTYWPLDGSRYGLDPQHAQANGSFYIDQRLGRIHFSSNVSGKVVILDYISDSLGTNDEMKVHKFAEEAMYKWIAHAILSGKSDIPEYQVNRFKKERFAAIRNAKLRLSNIKLEEITQILRGKSKQIKH